MRRNEGSPHDNAIVNGKQVRIKRASTVEGMPVDEFIMKNADPIWLHQNEMWELIPVEEPYSDADSNFKRSENIEGNQNDLRNISAPDEA
jgi:hypothetical protein